MLQLVFRTTSAQLNRRPSRVASWTTSKASNSFTQCYRFIKFEDLTATARRDRLTSTLEWRIPSWRYFSLSTFTQKKITFWLFITLANTFETEQLNRSLLRRSLLNERSARMGLRLRRGTRYHGLFILSDKTPM